MIKNAIIVLLILWLSFMTYIVIIKNNEISDLKFDNDKLLGINKLQNHIADNYLTENEKLKNKYRNKDENLKLDFQNVLDILFSLIYVESNGNIEADNGEDIGLTQINKRYLDYYLNKYWDKKIKFDISNPFHTKFLTVSILYNNYLFFKDKKKMDNNALYYTLLSYNRGINGSLKFANPENDKYIKKIKNHIARYTK